MKRKDIIYKTNLNTSATNSPIKEKIRGGYNTYDNILKLMQIIPVSYSHGILTWTRYAPPSMDVFYEASFTHQIKVAHNCINTPFIKQDMSRIGVEHPNYQITISFDVSYDSQFIYIDIDGFFFAKAVYEPPSYEETAPDPIPANTYTVNLFIYHLNTKKPLDK